MLKDRPLCILFPKNSVNRGNFDESQCMSFLIKDEENLEKYNEIWENVSNIIKSEFNTDPAHNKK